jgi:hypothetical protein
MNTKMSNAQIDDILADHDIKSAPTSNTVDVKQQPIDEKKVEQKQQVDEKKEEKKQPSDEKKASNRKLSNEEKTYIIGLLENYKIEAKELPVKAAEDKPTDVLKKILSVLKTKHRILTLWNNNKLLVLAKHILHQKYNFGKKEKKVTTADVIIERINKLQSQLKKINDNNDVEEELFSA